MLTRLLFLLLLNSGIACQSLFAFTGEHGTVVYDQPLQSELLHRDFYYTVYLPHDYTETKLYPVLYLLHGYGGTQNDWYVHDHLDVVADSMIAEGLIPEMVIVKPRGGTWMYIDNYKNKGILYQQFFFEEFVPYFESHYSVCRDRQTRAIGGYSMGGYGSLHYGVMHHDMFCYVYAMSSVIYGSDIPDLSDIVDDYDPADLPDITLEV